MRLRHRGRRGHRRPAADREVQFNDFASDRLTISSGNKRGQAAVPLGRVDYPMVVRMPWGGSAPRGDVSSQIRSGFYRIPGLKIVVPSTPQDARALMASDGRGYRSGSLLRAHQHVPRNPRSRGALTAEAPDRFHGQGGARRAGERLAIIPTAHKSTSACTWRTGMRRTGIEASVLDLRVAGCR